MPSCFGFSSDFRELFYMLMSSWSSRNLYVVIVSMYSFFSQSGQIEGFPSLFVAHTTRLWYHSCCLPSSFFQQLYAVPQVKLPDCCDIFLLGSNLHRINPPKLLTAVFSRDFCLPLASISGISGSSGVNTLCSFVFCSSQRPHISQ